MNTRFSLWRPCWDMKLRILGVLISLVLMAQGGSGNTVTVAIHGASPFGLGDPLYPMGLDLFTYWDAQPGGAVEYKYEGQELKLTGMRGTPGSANNIIVFDWEYESFRQQGGYDEAAGDALFAMLLQQDLLDSDYLHLIGHSRGAIVASEAAQRILHYGYELDQLTLLDYEPGPFPMNLAGNSVAWEGIGFVDNYYGSDFTMHGEPIDGAYDVFINKSHTKFPEWYRETINDPNATTGFHWRVNDLKPNFLVTGSPSPVVAPPDIINGDFEYGTAVGEYKATEIAGWNYHGGGGEGHVDLDPGGFDLELDYGDNWKRHNWLYAPDDAVELVFDARVGDASSNDEFFVYLAPYLDGQPSSSYQPLSLSSTTGWLTYAVDISEFSGSVFRFQFKIDAPGLFNIVDSEVYIDNVRFMYVPEPSTFMLCSLVTFVIAALVRCRGRQRYPC